MYYWRVKRQKRGVSRPTPHYYLAVSKPCNAFLATSGCAVAICSTRSAIRSEVVATMVLTWLAVVLAVVLCRLAMVEVTVVLAWLVGVVVTPVAAVVVWLVVWLVVHRRRTAMQAMICTYTLGRYSYIYNDLLWSAVE